MSLPQVVAFDIDGTLTESKQPMTPEMIALFTKLLSGTSVALTSGGKLELATTQIVSRLPESARLEHLFLLPTSGSALYVHKDGAWTPIYEERLTDTEAAHIMDVLRTSAEDTGIIDFSSPSFGERIENRGSQISLSALGQHAPIPEKQAWDPDRTKRMKLQSVIAPKLPEYDIKLGGLTTFDVTKHGINKAYGLRKLSEYLSIPISEMLYVGDALFPGGNDEVVKETGVKTRQVANPHETAELIQALVG